LTASSTPASGFKPFLADEAKQKRYEQFLAANLKDDTEITQFLADLQPVTLSLWDREMEKKEFIQAAKIYRPLAGLMLDRFVSEATVQAQEVQEQIQPAEHKKIVMERTKSMWKPNALLCKRYNIAEPFGGALPDPEKELKAKPKMSIFDYLETSINTKANFQTPSIIPKHIEVSKQQQKELVTLPPVEPVVTLEEAKPEPAKEPASASISKPSFVPRTPLEQAVDAARDKPISEKTDLFKSIFEDSDEEMDTAAALEKEQEQQPAADKLAAMQAALGLPSSSTSAAAANVLRNNSPPRGIFAALFKPSEEQVPQTDPASAAAPAKFAPIEGNKLKIAYKSREERLKNDKELAMSQVPAEELYGPKLPASQVKQTPPDDTKQAEASIDAKLQQLWQQHATTKRKPEKWVERKLSSSDSDDSIDSEEDSSDSSDCSSSKAKRAKSKKSHKKSSAKKSKKSKLKSKKKAKKSEKSKQKAKKKKSKH